MGDTGVGETGPPPDDAIDPLDEPPRVVTGATFGTPLSGTSFPPAAADTVFDFGAGGYCVAGLNAFVVWHSAHFVGNV